MSTLDRRTFLKLVGSGAMAASLPATLQKALAIPAHTRTRSIEDVEHIVILTQENRSFDHYFGTLRGVRGFNDPRAVRLPNGHSVWRQSNGSTEVQPFRPAQPNLGRVFMEDVAHGWEDSHEAWNEGAYDRWLASKGSTAMTYLTRGDLPYHYALADAFTVCDAYYCSLLGPTDPNRYHMWTGWTGNDGNGGGPVVDNAEVGYDWTSYPERLQAAGISWKVYQDIGHGLDAPGFWGWTGDAPYIGNYGDNSLLYLHQYQNAPAGSALARGAKTGTNIEVSGTLFDQFRDDVRNGKLPQVSWIAAPEAYSEHPNFPPNYGAWYISQFIETLASNPDLWSRTALFVNYDENGGFFDHMIPPTPPQSSAHGLSTVDANDEIFPGNSVYRRAPYGFGVRVPMLVVSPWSRGGYVNSQVFDHTSLIRFLEARFAHGNSALVESNITRWRRTVAGDLTTAFDFRTPNGSRPRLPSTASFVPQDLARHPDYHPVPPVNAAMPNQEPGIRWARALPYALHAQGERVGAHSFQLRFENAGAAGAVLHVRALGIAGPPRSYTLEPHTQLTDEWQFGNTYDLSVYGPNGFLRAFKGATDGAAAHLEVQSSYNIERRAVRIEVTNHGAATRNVKVREAYSRLLFEEALAPGASSSWTVTGVHGWYDITVQTVGDATFVRQLAGHIENGRDSISDPAMAGHELETSSHAS